MIIRKFGTSRDENELKRMEEEARIFIERQKSEPLFEFDVAPIASAADRARFLAENIYQLNYINMFDRKEMSFRIPDKEYGDEVNEHFIDQFIYGGLFFDKSLPYRVARFVFFRHHPKTTHNSHNHSTIHPIHLYTLPVRFVFMPVL